MKHIGIIGSGTMGHGIAELCAVSGFNVVLVDVNNKILKEAYEKITWSLKNLSNKKILKEAFESIMNRIQTSTTYESLNNVDCIIEAIVERSEAKRKLFSELDNIAKPSCIFATNTSTIPLSEISADLKRKDKFIGLHFSNPPILMPIVEIILSEKTSVETLDTIEKIAEILKRDYILVKKDIPGFVLNRMNTRTFIEAIRMIEEGYIKEDIDAMVRFRLDFPMGFCELLDFVGIDVVYYAVKEMVSNGFDVAIPGIFEEMINNERLGVKTGKGFYEYPKPNKYIKPSIVPTEGMYHVNPLRIIAPAVNEASWLIRNDIVSKENIEKIMIKGMNWPFGPLWFADRMGIDNIVSTLNMRQSKIGLSEYQPDSLLIDMLNNNKTGVKSGKGFYEWDYKRMDFGSVRYEKCHNYAIITIDRKEKLNTLNEDVWDGLKQAFEKGQYEEILAIVLKGEGRAFCAGDDISMMKNWRTVIDADSWEEKYANPLFDVLLTCKKPIISLVHGIAAGGGCEINFFADIVIASDKAMFSLPEGYIGALPPIATSMGAALFNMKFARFALTGEWMSAKKAMDMGLVDQVVPLDQLEITCEEFINKMSKLAPLSIEKIKSNINEIKQQYKGIKDIAMKQLTILAGSDDFKDGMKAFLEKRKPVWRKQ